LDVGGRARRREDARRVFGVEILGQRGRRAMPRGAGETALPLAVVAFRPELRVRRIASRDLLGFRCKLWTCFRRMRMLMNRAGRAAYKDVERRCSLRRGLRWGR